MPLNHIVGEHISGMDAVHRVVPLKKYQDLTNLTTPVKELTGNNFKREIFVDRPIWDAALGHAQIVFHQAGASRLGTSYDVVVQEYPRTGHVVFIFCAKINGEDHYVDAPFALAPEQIADLKVRGLWHDQTIQ